VPEPTVLPCAIIVIVATAGAVVVFVVAVLVLLLYKRKRVKRRTDLQIDTTRISPLQYSKRNKQTHKQTNRCCKLYKPLKGIAL